VKCREYTLEDKEGILEISSHIWEGRDYLPKWIDIYDNDPYSTPVVVEDEERIISVANMRFISPEIVWLEAIRTHPDSRGKGIATALTRYMLELAREKGAEAIWLSTANDQPSTRIILERIGFKELMLSKLWRNSNDEAVNGLAEDGVLMKLEHFDQHFGEEAKIMASELIIFHRKIELFN